MELRVAATLKLLKGIDSSAKLYGEPRSATECPIANYIKENISGVIPVVHADYTEVFCNYRFEKLGRIMHPTAVSTLIREIDSGEENPPGFQQRSKQL